VPPFGAGPGPNGYLLTADATKKVTDCLDKNNLSSKTAGQFQQCINAAAYSLYIQFTSDRVISK
jgi:hypothetical protein